MKTKIAIVQPVMSPNREPIFGYLSKSDRYQIKLFILCKKLAERPGWDLNDSYCFECESVDTISLNLSNRISNKDYSEPYRFPYGLFKSLYKYKPNLVIVSNATEAFFCLLLRLIIRFDIAIIAADINQINDKKISLVKYFKKIIYKSLNFYFVYGEQSEKFFLNLGVNPEKITKTYWSVDNRLFNSALSKKIGKIIKSEYSNKFVVLSVGQLIPRKGFRELISAWNKLPENVLKNSVLLIIGSGEQKEELYQQSLLNDNSTIIFFEHIPHDKLADYYNASDIFVFPTLEDVWGLVVNEAMASGLPVICSMYAGCSSELIKNKVNGLIFDPLNEISFVNTLIFMYENRDKLSFFSSNSLGIINNYSLENTAEIINQRIIKYVNSTR